MNTIPILIAAWGVIRASGYCTVSDFSELGMGRNGEFKTGLRRKRLIAWMLG